MTSFIHDVLVDLKTRTADVSEFIFVLPSKRSVLFLKHELSKVYNKTFFAPRILTIEEFVEELSQLRLISNIELLFEFYNSYSEITPNEETDSFDRFSKWARIVIQDFNDIDRFLVPHKHIFQYLSAIQDLKHWSLQDEPTDLIKNYLVFWKRLESYYTHFSNALINKGLGYQGLIYREAVENLENYIQANPERQHVFIGFNALNVAESSIFQELLNNGLAEVFWDIDEAFIESPNHAAGHFMSKYRKQWPYYRSHDFNWVADPYSGEKDISVVGVPKNIGQAKYMGELLGNLRSTSGDLGSTAVVLGDENLLIPLSNSIPANIGPMNITMGYPLYMTPAASLFDRLLILHKDRPKSYHYKDIIALLSHQFIRALFQSGKSDPVHNVLSRIKFNNIAFLSEDNLVRISEGANEEDIRLLFGDWHDDPRQAIRNCRELIYLIRDRLDSSDEDNLLGLEYLFKFHEVFNNLERLNEENGYIKTINELRGLYKELITAETLNFQGEPLRGLQIMGMLESRVLDFDTVIISSVNEGVLPSGKISNSFIPFDVRVENGIPTYKERDAIYTYHFYRLLQRAKTVYLLYNTEPDVLYGGEKSRFITQMEVEGIHQLKQYIVTPVTPTFDPSDVTIPKSPEVISAIRSVVKTGLSPSSLTNYIRNPLDFYYEKILGIKQQEEVEETVAANTLGTIIHNTLELLYKPIEGRYLTEEDIGSMRKKMDAIVSSQFKAVFREGRITEGKNLIIYEIAKRYISNFLSMELASVKRGDRIEILAVESDITIPLDMPELDFPVNLKGKVDRLDRYNETVRVIDYKTGKVLQNQLEIINWKDITTDYTKFSKAFQVLLYSYMIRPTLGKDEPMEAGIISFKNLRSGFLRFAKKDKPGAHARKETLIDPVVMDDFTRELKSLILEICDPEIPFIEKQV